jgi:hypothetical protein
VSRNEASKTRTLDIAFVVDANLLRRLATILSETSDKLEYTVKYSDGTSVHYPDIEDVIGQPNSKERSIVSLIAGPGDERVKSAYVNLKKIGSPSLEYTINGTQRDVIYFADQLDDWVSAVRQWYSPLFFSAGAVLGIVAFLLPLYIWGRVSPIFFPNPPTGDWRSWVQVLALVAMWAAEYYVLKLFPRGVFAIGRGEKQHQFFVFVRNAVLIGFAVSVAASFFVNWFGKHF